MNQTKLLILSLILMAASASALEITHDSPTCKMMDAKYPALQKVVTPAWSKAAQVPLNASPTKLASTMQGPIEDINELAHSLNEVYLQKISNSLYFRLVSAAEVGLDLQKFQPSLEHLSQRCALRDASGQSFPKESMIFRNLPREVDTDFKALHLSEMGETEYLKLLVIAAIEAHRLEGVLKFLGQKASYGDYGRETGLAVNKSLAENARRLIRLHFAFPILGDLKTSHIENELYAQFAFSNPFYFDQDIAQFFSHPQLEAVLRISPVGRAPVQMGPVPFAPPATDQAKYFYANLYNDILRGKARIPFSVVDRLRKSIAASVNNAIQAAELKCANPSPCSALSVDPNFASQWIQRLQATQTLAPLACACRIGAERETINGNVNLGLGLVSSAAFIGAVLQPELAPLVYAAYALTIADMGAAGAGIYDGIDNYNREQQLSLARSGGATDEAERTQTLEDNRKAQFNLLYDLGTGVIGLLPPGKVTQAYAKMSLKTVIRNKEFLKESSVGMAKGATAAPAPDLNQDLYSLSWDPSRLSVPLPLEVRSSYPRLFANLQSLAGKGRFMAKPVARAELLRELKFAAERMVQENSAEDLQMLARGEVRADLCSSAEAKKLSFVK